MSAHPQKVRSRHRPDVEDWLSSRQLGGNPVAIECPSTTAGSFAVRWVEIPLKARRSGALRGLACNLVPSSAHQRWHEHEHGREEICDYQHAVVVEHPRVSPQSRHLVVPMVEGGRAHDEVEFAILDLDVEHVARTRARRLSDRCDSLRNLVMEAAKPAIVIAASPPTERSHVAPLGHAPDVALDNGSPHAARSVRRLQLIPGA